MKRLALGIILALTLPACDTAFEPTTPAPSPTPLPDHVQEAHDAFHNASTKFGDRYVAGEIQEADAMNAYRADINASAATVEVERLAVDGNEAAVAEAAANARVANARYQAVADMVRD